MKIQEDITISKVLLILGLATFLCYEVYANGPSEDEETEIIQAHKYVIT